MRTCWSSSQATMHACRTSRSRPMAVYREFVYIVGGPLVSCPRTALHQQEPRGLKWPKQTAQGLGAPGIGLGTRWVNNFATLSPTGPAPLRPRALEPWPGWDQVGHMGPGPGPQGQGPGARARDKVSPRAQACPGLAKKHDSAMKMKHFDAKSTTVQ